MSKHPKEQLFYDIVDDWFETYKEKNSDYGDSFSKLLEPEEIGPVSFVTRAADKMERLKALVRKPAKVKSETFEDTVKDLGNYCAMYLMWAKDGQSKVKSGTAFRLRDGVTLSCEGCGKSVQRGEEMVGVPPENRPYCTDCALGVYK